MDTVPLSSLLLPAAVVAMVAVAALLVAYVGLRPQTAAAPVAAPPSPDERRKKKKSKDKKSPSNGQVTHESEVKSKKVVEPKKSPVKEKPKEVKAEKKPKEKPEPKKTKEPKEKTKKEVAVKPADYDEGDWEKVPSKSDKKNKNKKEDDKKESPVKENKKKNKQQADKKESTVSDYKNASPEKSGDILKVLKELMPEKQHLFEEMEKRERSMTPLKSEETPNSSTPATPDIKKKAEAEPVVEKKGKKKQTSDDFVIPPVNADVEESDNWTDAKAPKKGKKKVRKDQ